MSLCNIEVVLAKGRMGVAKVTIQICKNTLFLACPGVQNDNNRILTQLFTPFIGKRKRLL